MVSWINSYLLFYERKTKTKVMLSFSWIPSFCLYSLKNKLSSWILIFFFWVLDYLLLIECQFFFASMLKVLITLKFLDYVVVSQLFDYEFVKVFFPQQCLTFLHSHFHRLKCFVILSLSHIKSSFIFSLIVLRIKNHVPITNSNLNCFADNQVAHILRAYMHVFIALWSTHQQGQGRGLFCVNMTLQIFFVFHHIKGWLLVLGLLEKVVVSNLNCSIDLWTSTGKG